MVSPHSVSFIFQILEMCKCAEVEWDIVFTISECTWGFVCLSWSFSVYCCRNNFELSSKWALVSDLTKKTSLEFVLFYRNLINKYQQTFSSLIVPNSMSFVPKPTMLYWKAEICFSFCWTSKHRSTFCNIPLEIGDSKLLDKAEELEH